MRLSEDVMKLDGWVGADRTNRRSEEMRLNVNDALYPGDVVLTCAEGSSAMPNRRHQGWIKRNSHNYPKTAKYTHVLLCVRPFIVVDATVENGVRLHDLVGETLSGNPCIPFAKDHRMMVIRPKQFAQLLLEDMKNGFNEDVDTAMQGRASENELNSGFGASALQEGKRYNWHGLIRNASRSLRLPFPRTLIPFKENSAYFCSELVAALLVKMAPMHRGFLPKDWKVGETYPIDFEMLASDKHWVVVTDQWRRWLEYIDACRTTGDDKPIRELRKIAENSLRQAERDRRIELSHQELALLLKQ